MRVATVRVYKTLRPLLRWWATDALDHVLQDRLRATHAVRTLLGSRRHIGRHAMLPDRRQLHACRRCAADHFVHILGEIPSSGLLDTLLCG